MGFVYLVLMCIIGGVIVGSVGLLFSVLKNRNPKVEAHFEKNKGRYLTFIGAAVILAAAIYISYSTPDNDDPVVHYDNRSNPLDEN